MVKQSRLAVRTDVHRHPAAQHQRLGVIDGDRGPVHEAHQKGLERPSLHERPQRSLKVVAFHLSSPHLAYRIPQVRTILARYAASSPLGSSSTQSSKRTPTCF